MPDHWRPAATLETLATRARLLAATRRFFSARGLLEVETPMLIANPVSDPHIDNLRVTVGGRSVFLHSSPEYHMKRLLAAGAPDIWQLCKVFRDGERGAFHEPEFTMVEWYRHGYTLERMAAETCTLIGELAAEAGAPPRRPQYRTYQQLFLDALQIDPLEARPDELRDGAVAKLGERLGEPLRRELGNDRNALLDLLMSHIVSAELRGDPLVVVSGFPSSQAALARLDPQDARIAERFEVFCHGLEVANGYRELRDPDEQRRRFSEDASERSRLGRRASPPDERFLAALGHGLPDCAGVAVGFDRVAADLLGLPALAGVLSFRAPEDSAEGAGSSPT